MRMDDDDKLLMKRFTELAERSFALSRYTYSEFLTIAEQDVLASMKFSKSCAPFRFEGGYEHAERRIACFGNADICGYIEDPDIVCICVEPISVKFSENLSHRDFLGALMSLGIRRPVLGDIFINNNNNAYVFCLDSIADYIADALDSVRNTPVNCRKSDYLPAEAKIVTHTAEINVASTRLDVLISAIYNLSREESRKLVVGRMVAVNSRLTENTSFSPDKGDIISVRGYGRFIFDGIERETKRGRLKGKVTVYGDR